MTYGWSDSLAWLSAIAELLVVERKRCTVHLTLFTCTRIARATFRAVQNSIRGGIPINSHCFDSRDVNLCATLGAHRLLPHSPARHEISLQQHRRLVLHRRNGTSGDLSEKLQQIKRTVWFITCVANQQVNAPLLTKPSINKIAISYKKTSKGKFVECKMTNLSSAWMIQNQLYTSTLTRLPPWISANDFILLRVVFGGCEQQVGEFNVASGRIIGEIRDENSPKYAVQGEFRLHSRYTVANAHP